MTKAASVQLRMGAFAFLLAMASAAVVSTAHAANTNFNNGASKANKRFWPPGPSSEEM